MSKDKRAGVAVFTLQFPQCIFRTIRYCVVRIALGGHPRRVVLTLVIIWSAGQPSNSELPTQCLLLIADISSAQSAGYNVLLEAISLSTDICAVRVGWEDCNSHQSRGTLERGPPVMEQKL